MSNIVGCEATKFQQIVSEIQWCIFEIRLMIQFNDSIQSVVDWQTMIIITPFSLVVWLWHWEGNIVSVGPAISVIMIPRFLTPKGHVNWTWHAWQPFHLVCAVKYAHCVVLLCFCFMRCVPNVTMCHWCHHEGYGLNQPLPNHKTKHS